MKVGDLVRCLFQPRCGGYDSERKVLISMKHDIEGELGIIVEPRNDNWMLVMFPQLNGYTHPLSPGVLEVINECR